MTISKSYYHTLLHTILLSFSISTIQTLNYTNIFRELLPNNGKHFFQTLYQTIVALSEPLQNNTTLFRINFKQYIQGELLSNNNGFFQILYQTMAFPEGFYKTCHTLFQNSYQQITEINIKCWLSQNSYQPKLTPSESFYQTIVKIIFRVHTKRYWHFQRFSFKQHYKIRFF